MFEGFKFACLFFCANVEPWIVHFWTTRGGRAQSPPLISLELAVWEPARDLQRGSGAVPLFAAAPPVPRLASRPNAARPATVRRTIVSESSTNWRAAIGLLKDGWVGDVPRQG